MPIGKSIRTARQQLWAWYPQASKAYWKTQANNKKEYPSASILEGKRVVFNMKGNYYYRLIVKINDDSKMAWIQMMETRAQYDNIDASNM